MSSPHLALGLTQEDGKCRISKLWAGGLFLLQARPHMSRHRGDDLEDDYMPDELVASSGEEDVGANNDIQGLLSADEDPDEDHEEKRQTTSSAKRKRREKDKERKEKVGGCYTVTLSQTYFPRRGENSPKPRMTASLP